MCLTKQELSEIERRAEKATPGPWKAINHNFMTKWKNVISESDEFLANYLNPNDAEFITHAREDVPRLVEEVSRLKSELLRIWEIIEGSSYYGEFERAYEQLKELEGGE